jgi:hypothetical protein
MFCGQVRKLFVKSRLFLLPVVLIGAISAVIVNARQASSFSKIEFFKGNWECQLQDSSRIKFRWSVAEGLNGGWLVGAAESSGKNVTKDFWRLVDGKIDRFVFMEDGTFLRVNSNGWAADTLRFAGSASPRGGEFNVRAIITKKSDRSFHALWEKMGSDRRWSTMANEVCTK